MYRLQFVYSNGTDEFDYWDEIETYDHEFETPLALVETFIEMAKSHPQIEHYMIVDSQHYKEPLKSIYHFIMENFKDQECYDLADRVYEVTKLDRDEYSKFFGPVESKTEACEKTVSINDLTAFDLEWIVEALEQQVTSLILKKEHIQTFIKRLRSTYTKDDDEEKEYQEYLRLKEKFGGEY